MKRVRVCTREYEAAHGRKPRGTGLWAFFYGESDQGGTAIFFEGTFTLCKVKAQRAAREDGHSLISVGS